MSDEKELLYICGIAFIIMVSICIGVILYIMIQGLWDNFHKWYIVTHRFKKKPIAKCHCCDCQRSYISSNCDRRCSKFDNGCVADDWFCWDATVKPILDKKLRN